MSKQRNISNAAQDFKKLPNWEHRDYNTQDVEDITNWAGQRAGLTVPVLSRNAPLLFSPLASEVLFYTAYESLKAGYVRGYRAAKRELRKAGKNRNCPQTDPKTA